MPILVRSVGHLAQLLRRKSKTETRVDSMPSPMPRDDCSMQALSLARFLGLPNELQIEVLSKLRIKDIFALRLTCRELYFLTELHQSSLVWHLWPLDFGSTACHCWCGQHSTKCGVWLLSRLTFNHYYRLSHQDFVVTHLANLLGFFVGRKVLRIPIRNRDEVGPLWPFSTSFWRRIHQPLMHILQWLLEYRERLVETVERKQHISHEVLESSIFETFSLTCLLHSWGMFKILTMVLKWSLRPPMYAGKVERTIRGWTKAGVSDEDIVKLLVFGGFDSVVSILQTEGYSARRLVFDDFLYWLHGSSHPDKTTTSRNRQDNRIAKVAVGKRRSESRILEHVATNEQQQSQSHLTRIDCTVYPRLNHWNISQVSKYLPDLQSFFTKSAERLILKKDYRFSESRDLPSSMAFISWAFSNNAVGTHLDSDEDGHATVDYTSDLNVQDVELNRGNI